jgi:hypothetical protein
MKKLFTFIALITFLTPLSIKAQENSIRMSCGTSISDLKSIVNDMDALRTKYKGMVFTRGAVSYVPIHFHVVAAANGTGRVSKIKLLDLMDAVNKIYADNGLELQFYLKGFKDINNDAVYNTPRTLTGNTISFNNKVSDAINIFITNNAGTTSDDGVLAYYSKRYTGREYETDWIVVSKAYAKPEQAIVLAHELGHFFSLAHTFSGWEPAPFSPTASNPCAPRLASDEFSTVELASRGADGNCATAADKFCDTPADYNFGFTQGRDWNNPGKPCVYNGIAKDPTCVAVDPDETNLMGYYLATTGCQSKFSAEQKAAMMRDYSVNSARQYLRNGNTTPFLGTVDIATLIAPANTSTVSDANNINLDWSDVSNVTEYIVDINSRDSLLAGVEYRSYRTTNSNLTLNATLLGPTYLQPNTLYYWRVRAYNTYKTGTSTAINTFRTGALSEIKEIEGVSNFQISPNPIGQERRMLLSLTSEKAFEGQLKIYNITGQLVKSDKQSFISGLNQRDIDVADLRNGMYIFSIESADRVVKKKFMLVD